LTKTTKPAAAPAPTPNEPVADSSVRETPDLRDEFAMRIAAGLIGAVVQRGGTYAVEDAYGDDDLMKTAYFYADMAMRVRVAP
jgi:hypothetical protein